MHRACREGGRWPALTLALLDCGHTVGCTLQGVHDGPRIGLVFQLHLLAPDTMKRCQEARALLLAAALLLGQFSLDGPVLLRNEGLDFPLPFDYQPQGHRLHPPRR